MNYSLECAQTNKINTLCLPEEKFEYIYSQGVLFVAEFVRLYKRSFELLTCFYAITIYTN